MEQINQMPIAPLGSRTPKSLIVIGGVVVIILAVLAWVYFFTDIGKSPQVVREEKKADLLERVNETDNLPLSEKEKLDILEKFGGGNTAQYNFTAEEKDKVLRALNGR